MKIGVISVTKLGDKIAQMLNNNFNIQFISSSFTPNFNLIDSTEKLIKTCKAIIFISSTGIAVRAIAPFLKNKTVDPAILVIDCKGTFVISLLSGHLGGANELTLKVANILNSKPVITTATDNLGIDAPDMIAKKYNLVIDDLKKAKLISSKLIERKNVAFVDENHTINLPRGYIKDIKAAKFAVYITNKSSLPINNIDILKLIRKNIVLGIGCRKNFNPESMRNSVLSTLKNYNIDPKSINSISTVEIKKHEKAIIDLANYLDCPLNIYTLDEIKKIHHKYKGSDFVEKSIGVRAVCEPCVELNNANFITSKIILNGMTLCIGELKIN